MDVIQLTRRLIDIPSVTGAEIAVAEFLAAWLAAAGFRVQRQELGGGRANLFVSAGGPTDVILCSHMDTVPPFFPCREDAEHLYGRGACDTKGSVAAMISAGISLRFDGFDRFAFLFVAGEETDSCGARAAVSLNPGSRFLIIGEPTGNRLALAHKGVLLLHLKTRGLAAHSAFPHLGDSAVHCLLDVLQSIRGIVWEEDPVLGKSTVNIGVIEGGREANVIAAEASARIMIRCAVSASRVLERVLTAIGDRAVCEIVSKADPFRFGCRPGYETTVLPFGTDAPHLTGFGETFLIGPGRPEDAHTDGEKVTKRALASAVEIYRKLVRDL
ncbi:MAG: M20/M25/M40 family metallo-hydrolase, partial [Candidatus Aminicenantales bacterium]